MDSHILSSNSLILIAITFSSVVGKYGIHNEIRKGKRGKFQIHATIYFFLTNYIMSLWDSFLQVLEVPCHSTSQDSLDNKNFTMSLMRPNDL